MHAVAGCLWTCKGSVSAHSAGPCSTAQCGRGVVLAMEVQCQIPQGLMWAFRWLQVVSGSRNGRVAARWCNCKQEPGQQPLGPPCSGKNPVQCLRVGPGFLPGATVLGSPLHVEKSCSPLFSFRALLFTFPWKFYGLQNKLFENCFPNMLVQHYLWKKKKEKVFSRALSSELSLKRLQF